MTEVFILFSLSTMYSNFDKYFAHKMLFSRLFTHMIYLKNLIISHRVDILTV